MSKRSFGEVSELPSGKFRARYTGPDGRRHKADTTFFEKDDATAWLRGEEKLIEFKEWTPPAERTRTREEKQRTVGDWLTQWLEIRKPDLAPSAHQDYERTLNARIIKITGAPARLRDVPLLQLRRRDIIEWWDACNRVTGGPQTYTHTAFRRLHTALNDAVDRDLIPANPATGIKAIKPPTAKRKEMPELPVMEAILEEMSDEKKLVTILTLFHGVRIGEVLALRRRDVIDDGDTIHVKIRATAWRKIGEGMQIKNSPKTDAGHRDVPVFPRFHTAVRDHLAKHTGTAADAFLFTTATGRILMDTSYRSALKAAKDRAGHEEVRITPHYGRNWIITQLAEAHMTPMAIGLILGQRDLKTITEVYMRATEAKTRSILDEVGKVLDKSGEDELEAKRREKEQENEKSMRNVR